MKIKIWYYFAGLLLLVSIITVTFLPYGTRSFEPSKIKPFYANMLFATIAYISLIMASDGFKDLSETSISDKYNLIERSAGKTISTLLVNLLFLFSILPISLIVFVFGDSNLVNLGRLYAFILFGSLGFSWIGIFIGKVLPKFNTVISNYFILAFILLIGSNYSRIHEDIYLNLTVLKMVLITGFCLVFYLIVSPLKLISNWRSH